MARASTGSGRQRRQLEAHGSGHRFQEEQSAENTGTHMLDVFRSYLSSPLAKAKDAGRNA